MQAVRCRGVTKEFPAGEERALVLRGIDLDVAAGEMTLIAGPSGCGKTTLLSVITGLLTPSGGEVTVLGHPLSRMSSAEMVLFRRRNLGLVSQQFSLLPPLTIAENAALPLLAAGVSRREAVARASEMLASLGLGTKLKALPAVLSMGQQQRVALARALVHDPKLVVCDEPTSALDGETGEAVMEMLMNIAVHPERAILVVTHDQRVFPFADRIAWMNDGTIVRIEEPGVTTEKAHGRGKRAC